MEFLYSIKNQLGETLNISYDVCTESPRSWDNLGVVCTPVDKQYGWLNENSDIELWQSKEEDHKKLSKYLYLPIYALIHSNISLTAAWKNPYNCPFDSGLFGYIYTTKEKVKKWLGVKRLTKKYQEKALEMLAEKVSTLSQYLNGDVYEVEKLDIDGHEVDYIGGFYDVESIKGYFPEFADELDKEVKYL
jgi:hypothetical protein